MLGLVVIGAVAVAGVLISRGDETGNTERPDSFVLRAVTVTNDSEATAFVDYSCADCDWPGHQLTLLGNATETFHLRDGTYTATYSYDGCDDLVETLAISAGFRYRVWSCAAAYAPRGVSQQDRDRVEHVYQSLERGEITDAEAERTLGDIASDVGVEAFTWIVRNVPVYDRDSGTFQRFDTYARNLAAESGIAGPLGDDPVGEVVDILTGSDIGDILDSFDSLSD